MTNPSTEQSSAPTNNMLQRCEHAKCCVNAWILPFLNIFGVEEGNGPTSLAATATFNKPADLSGSVVIYFQPPPRDNRV